MRTVSEAQELLRLARPAHARRLARRSLFQRSAPDRMGGMSQSERGEESGQGPLEEEGRTFRVRFSDEEMDRLREGASRWALAIQARPLLVRYVRDVVLSPIVQPVPEFPPYDRRMVDRPKRLSMLLDEDEERLLFALCEQAGVNPERYIRWRLFGALV